MEEESYSIILKRAFKCRRLLGVRVCVCYLIESKAQGSDFFLWKEQGVRSAKGAAEARSF